MAAVHSRLEDDIAVLTIENPPVNSLSPPVCQGLTEGLDRAERDPAVRAVVLTGAAGQFAGGADVTETGSGEALPAPTLRELQARLETCSKPVIAAIEGAALADGFELAMACHWRVAAATAQVGLPQVRLGLPPGAGGTVRFTRLAGPQCALESITSGAPISAPRALELGLVDALFPQALPGAVEFARRVVAQRRPLRVAADLTERIAQVDAQIFSAFRDRIARRARGQLAPFRIIECIEASCTRSRKDALAFERAAFVECRDSLQHKALVHVFCAEREARRIPGIGAEIAPLPVRSAAVIGAGTMGGGIAMSFANAGIPVLMLEQSREALARGLATVNRHYEASVARGSLSEERAARALGLMRAVTDYGELAQADIVVEAVFEDLQVKQDVFSRLDRVAAPHAILATNTSTLDIDVIAAATSRPQQVVGTHFFSPANVMKLLENVRGRHTAPQVIVTVMALGRALGKVAVLAGNCDGFIGNRMLAFYGLEAEFLLEEGATPQQIDRVIEGFGFAMGPLAVRDLAGNDVGYMIRKGRKLPADERVSPILQRLVERGRLGQKSGKGFYRYEGRARVADPEVLLLIEDVSRELGIKRRAIADQEILERLLHPLVNEGARILEEGIAIRAGDIDVVYVNGYGFPAWRGGPMFWGRQSGLAQVADTMARLAATHGARWRPAQLLQRLAASGEGWTTIRQQDN